MKYIRYRDLKARGVFGNRATLTNWIRKYGFPPGRVIGNARLWSEDEVDAWIASQPTSTRPVAPASYSFWKKPEWIYLV